MRHTRKEVDLAPLLSEGLARDGAPGSHRGAQPVADGAGQPPGLHAGAAAGAPTATEGAWPEAAVRLRAQGRRITLQTFHRVNFRKFGGGPKGICYLVGQLLRFPLKGTALRTQRTSRLLPGRWI